MPSDSLVMEELGQGRKWLGPRAPRCQGSTPGPLQQQNGGGMELEDLDQLHRRFTGGRDSWEPIPGHAGGPILGFLGDQLDSFFSREPVATG